MPDKIVNILLFLAQGFEDLEAVAVLDIFGWTQYREEILKASVTTAAFHNLVRGRFGVEIKPDIVYPEINPEKYHALVLPGGFHSHGYDEAYRPEIHRLAREIYANGGYIATMCVGILPVVDAGLLRGKKATTYPFSRNHDNLGGLKAGGAVVIDQPVVIDDRIISCGGPGTSLEVAFLLMDRLMGPETVRKVRHYMLFREVAGWARCSMKLATVESVPGDQQHNGNDLNVLTFLRSLDPMKGREVISFSRDNPKGGKRVVRFKLREWSSVLKTQKPVPWTL